MRTSKILVVSKWEYIMSVSWFSCTVPKECHHLLSVSDLWDPVNTVAIFFEHVMDLGNIAEKRARSMQRLMDLRNPAKTVAKFIERVMDLRPRTLQRQVTCSKEENGHLWSGAPHIFCYSTTNLLLLLSDTARITITILHYFHNKTHPELNYWYWLNRD